MYQGLGVGLAILISFAGCAVKRPFQPMKPQDSHMTQSGDHPATVILIQEAIQQYHNFLEGNRRLLHPPFHYGGWPDPVELDPDTLEPIPPPPPPTQEEMIEKLNKLLQDPAFLKEWKANKELVRMMPAGSPSSASLMGPGARAACTGK